jgi:hypothetical protein
MEANAKHPSLVPPRDLQTLSAGMDWTANGKTTTMVPIGIDTTPSMGYVHSFRGGPDLEAHDDFQRVASTDSGTVPLPFGDAPNKIHPSTVAPRDFDTDFGDLDWQLPGVKSSTYRAQAGFEPNRTHPSLMNARELEKMDAGMDWQQGGNGNQLITRTKEYEDDDGQIKEIDWRKDLRGTPAKTFQPAAVGGGWNSSPHIGPGKCTLDRRLSPNLSRPSPKKTPKKTAAWTMGMLDAQRKQGRSTPAKQGQKENAMSKLAGGSDSHKRTAVSAPAGSKGKVSKRDAEPIATAILEPIAWQKVEGTAEAREYWWNVDTRETSWVDPLAKTTTIKKKKKKKKTQDAAGTVLA